MRTGHAAAGKHVGIDHLHASGAITLSTPPIWLRMTMVSQACAAVWMHRLAVSLNHLLERTNRIHRGRSVTCVADLGQTADISGAFALSQHLQARIAVGLHVRLLERLSEPVVGHPGGHDSIGPT
ncbi:hypothetical protein EAS62_37460 [Bradyrhizobium zhanjiangense]|uniref:Uncharacterized protein n=1 Tax=Bradyrhizobium zhanjiangense TaxID=1325107 RepID=A0ABY0D9F3_9BRAD|nr:hypothetical protein EAS62_37460 [Bradyrhizobium zhanjiangense]